MQSIKQKVRIIDGNNQFLIHYSKATSYPDLLRRLAPLNFGCDLVYWTFDGVHSRSKRKTIYPDYKNTKSRNKNNQDLTKYDLLRQFKKEDLPKIGGLTLIDVPLTEADDVIRTLVKIFREADPQGLKYEIEILSNDADLFDQTNLPNVFQPQSKLPNQCLCPSEIPLYKTLVGDSGDNIKGLKGFGETAWENLTSIEKKHIENMLRCKAPVFNIPIDFDPKLGEKLKKNWVEILMWYKVVSPIYVSISELNKYTTEYKKSVVKSSKRMTMD